MHKLRAMAPLLAILGVVAVLLVSAPAAQAVTVEVKTEQKISDTEGGFMGVLDDFDFFGFSLANLGDLDGDEVTDLAAGTPFDDDGGDRRGAVWVLFLNADGTVKAEQKISDTEGGFAGGLANNDRFGSSVANLGDLDGDGVIDLAVGASGDDDGGEFRGAVWVLFLAPKFDSFGECRSSLIELNCSGLTGRDRSSCNREQREICSGLDFLSLDSQ